MRKWTRWRYQFDFPFALWATDKLHNTYSQNKAGILSDVDFIVETEDSVLMIIYKNVKVPEAVPPEVFNPLDQKRENKIAFKYCDSWIYFSAMQKSKPIK